MNVKSEIAVVDDTAPRHCAGYAVPRLQGNTQRMHYQLRWRDNVVALFPARAAGWGDKEESTFRLDSTLGLEALDGENPCVATARLLLMLACEHDFWDLSRCCSLPCAKRPREEGDVAACIGADGRALAE